MTPSISGIRPSVGHLVGPPQIDDGADAKSREALEVVVAQAGQVVGAVEPVPSDGPAVGGAIAAEISEVVDVRES